MSALVYPLAPAVLPTQQAVQRLWFIRRLLREGALDLRAADTALQPLQKHPNRAVAALAGQTSDLVTAKFNHTRRGVA